MNPLNGKASDFEHEVVDTGPREKKDHSTSTGYKIGFNGYLRSVVSFLAVVRVLSDHTFFF